MKKIYGILFLLALMAFKTNVQAQTCAGVTAQAISMGPTPSPTPGLNTLTNDYVVRATLSHTYSQNVTVNGFFYDASGPANVDHPYTVIVAAGSLSEQTGQIYTADATAGGVATIESVTPCPTFDLSVVTNSNNPEENVGQMHNAGMAAVMPNYSSGLEPTGANAFSFTKSYLYSQGYDTTTLNSANSYDLQNYGQFYEQTDVASLANSMYNNGAISSTAKNYLVQLASYISSFAADSISIPSQAFYNSFANNLINNEDQFANNSSLTSNDKYILFSAYSVARHSVVFAVNYSNQNSYKSWFNWWDVLGGDVVGAGVGALGGAAMGAMAGGIGAGPGAAAGAVGGAITGSAYEAGMQLWHHFVHR